MNTSIAIGSTIIHQDENGRYSLNDLYQASGAAQKNRPKYWLKIKQTQDLILLLSGAEFRPAQE